MGRATRESAGAALFEVFRLHLIDTTVADELEEDVLKKARPEVLNALLGMLRNQRGVWFDDVTTPETDTRDDILLTVLEQGMEDLKESLMLAPQTTHRFEV